jgi:hypothetical protein
MFAIKGAVHTLNKCKSKNGGNFYRILLKKELKKQSLPITYMEFFCFYDRVNSKFDSSEIAVSDIIELTFYIKGVQRDEQNWTNNLMVTNITLIKKAVKKA